MAHTFSAPQIDAEKDSKTSRRNGAQNYVKITFKKTLRKRTPETTLTNIVFLYVLELHGEPPILEKYVFIKLF